MEELLRHSHVDASLPDSNGDTALHMAACGHPMAAYLLAKAAPTTVLAVNSRKETPVDVAVACERGEVRRIEAFLRRFPTWLRLMGQ